MEELMSYDNYNVEQINIGGSGFELQETVTIKAGQGVLKAGQVLAFEASDASLKYVKYVSGASNGTEKIRAVLLEEVDVSGTNDVTAKVLKMGFVNKGALKGINVIKESIIMDQNTEELVAGGSLTDATTYQYHVVGLSRSGITAPSVISDGITTSSPNLAIKVGFELPATMDAIRLWRTSDAGTTYSYYDITSEELDAREVIDNGSLTWVSGTPVLVTDIAGLKSLEDANIFPKEATNGYYLGK